MKRWSIYTLLLLGLFLCSSCTSIKVVPENIVKPLNKELVLQCKLLFEGNRAYLPSTVSDSKETDVSIDYGYKIFYDSTSAEKELLSSYIFMSPYTFLGLPTGGDDVLAVAKLVIRKKEQDVKTYFAQAKVCKTRSIFAGAVDKTELRRLALMAIKENLENQMLNDYEMLSKLTKEEKL
jgi:hypothetical protein